MVDDVSKAQARITELPEGDIKTFTEYQSEVVEACRNIVTKSHDMCTKAATNPTDIVTCSREITVSYNKLADATQGALATIESDDVSILIIY